MAIGSLDSYYSSGSLYKKFYGSTGSYLNKQSVAAYDAQLSAAGSIIFGQSVTESEGLSLLSAQAVQQRVIDAAQAKADGAAEIKSTALNLLA